jgi:hypothetical protein
VTIVRRAPARAGAQREVGVAQLALDQPLGASMLAAATSLCGARRADEFGKAHSGADLRRRQALAGRQLLDELLRHGDTFERLAHQALAGAGRRRLELQVVGKAAPEGRVDLLDAVR